MVGTEELVTHAAVLEGRLGGVVSVAEVESAVDSLG